MSTPTPPPTVSLSDIDRAMVWRAYLWMAGVAGLVLLVGVVGLWWFISSRT